MKYNLDSCPNSGGQYTYLLKTILISEILKTSIKREITTGRRLSRVVSCYELIENLWIEEVVTDSAPGARLKDARKAIGDSLYNRHEPAKFPL